jgi:hypothetical protein
LGVSIFYKKNKGHPLLQKFSYLYRRVKVSFGILFYIMLKCQINWTSERPCDKVQKLLYKNCIIFLVDLRFFFLFGLVIFYYYFQTCLGWCFLPSINRLFSLYLRFCFSSMDYWIKLMFCLEQHIFFLCLNKEQSKLLKYNWLCGALPYTSHSRFVYHWVGLHSNSVGALFHVIIVSHFLSNLIFHFPGLC